MLIEIKVPSLGESITEVEVGTWLKQEGDPIEQDEPVVDVESEKATVEVPAPAVGVLSSIKIQTGEAAEVGDVLGVIDTEAQAEHGDDRPTTPATPSAPPAHSDNKEDKIVMPAAKRVLHEKGVSADNVKGTGPGGRVLKEDVQIAASKKTPEPTKQAKAQPSSTKGTSTPAGERERVVRMSPIRRTIAARLVESKQTAALLTTFNEVDMHEAKKLRKTHQEAFVSAHGVKLGFMSMFVKAAVSALKDIPELNAEIRGDDIVYKNYYNIGIAVGGGKGLVVPVIRDADTLSFSGIESTIADFGIRAKAGKIDMNELQGGTFTISNGGVFGSMLSTPIVNPPQTGILGLHAIKDRPVVIGKEIVIRPVMYVALTYDHRIVDGKEAVTFLKSIKERVEDPARLLLEI